MNSRDSAIRTAFRLGRCVLLLLACACGPSVADGPVALLGHRTAAADAAQVVGEVAPAATIPLTLALAPRDPQGLSDLLRRLYSPGDPMQGHFLTPEQFADRFSPTPDQYAAVAAFARANGLTVTGTTPNRLLLHVEAPSATVEAAFGVHLQRLVDTQGRRFHAPDTEPKVPVGVAPLLTGVVGLDDSTVWRPQAVPLGATPDVGPLQAGSGPYGGLSPADIRSAYGLSGLPPAIKGTGQTLAVFELDGYKTTDITAYENQFAAQLGVTQFPTVTPVAVDGGSGPLGSGQAEVTLDIELQIAVAPGASTLLVYEGPNTGQGLLDTYNQIALDNRAKQISTSWGIAEDQVGSSFAAAEASVFAEMAAQGQTICAAAGDSGAFDDGSTLSVDDPASQPYVTGAGGTTLTLGAGSVRASESAWSSGGGGVSALWPIPAWQMPLIGAASGASATMRNVPDVSLDADPNTGYAIQINGSWAIYGGTSCASPLWAAFTALVNQQRAAAGKQPLGFANALLCSIGAGLYGSYPNDFYDVSSGNNGYYSAVSGYDDVTGLGTFNGTALWSDLTTWPSAGPVLTTTPGAAGVALSWTPVAGTAGYSVFRAATSGAEGGTALATGLTGTTYTDTHATAGTTYYYVVVARNTAGVAVPSNEATAAAQTPLTLQSFGASPATVNGTTTALSAQASAPQGQTPIFTWSATGPAAVTYSVNGAAAANSTTGTFTKAGTYSFTVTATDAAGQSATGTVPVTVSQTLTHLTVTPATASLTAGQTQQFAAAGTDQFGNAITPSPTWAITGGGTITAAGLFTAATPGGPYTVTAAQGAVAGAASVTVTAAQAPPPTPGNASAFMSQTVPATMAAGQPYTVSVTFQNTGTTTWTSAGNYHLGSQDPQDNTAWGLNRAYLPAGTSVASGQSATFTFTVTAPSAPGTYPMQWKVVQDGVQWFGAPAPIASVTVTGGSPAPTPGNASAFVSQTVPATMTAGHSYTVTVTYQNTGTTTWTSAGNYHLGSQDPQDNTAWGLNRAYLPAGTSVASGQSATFTFTVTAPSAPGTYPMQWKVVQDGVQWFGAPAPIASVTVTR